MLFAAILFFCAWHAGPGHAQEQKIRYAPSASDLSAQNRGRVAATVEEIKAVLTKDPGMMVELKRWVARDATEHGQFIGDFGLSSEGILARLEADLPFRSIATALVRQYGYLLPKLNPDSDAAKEHELLLEERVKRLARDQNEKPERTSEPQSGNSQEQILGHGAPGKDRGARTSPRGPDDFRPFGEENPPGLAPVLRTAEDSERAPAPSFMVDSSGSYPRAQPLNNLPVSVPGPVNLPDDAAGRLPDVWPESGNSGSATAEDGLLAEFGLDANIASADSSGAVDLNAENISDSSLVTSAAAVKPARVAPAAVLASPEMIRRLSPYESIPSLYDMYVQAVARPAALQRFGANVFQNGTRDSQLIPMDLPAGPDYVVGPGDGLSVDLWGGVSQRFYRVVDREGRVSLPEVGPVLVSGKSLADVQQSVQQVLRTEFRACAPFACTRSATSLIPEPTTSARSRRR
jgi:hypothetical protein